jgi:hypothetical protein
MRILSALLPLAASVSCTGIVSGEPTAGDPDVDQVSSDLPCDVAAVLDARCNSCHGSAAVPGIPLTLASYADLSAPSPFDPSQSVAELAVQRMKDGVSPMPPGVPAPSEDVAVLEAWVASGLAPGNCGASNPYDTPPRCSSEHYWAGADEESPQMHPGRACLACHEREHEGPRLLLAGTVYPSAHEPDECYGANGDATVVITGADGQTFSLRLGGSGNFFLEGEDGAELALPYTVVLRYEGRERAMVAPQTSGDCNHCHSPEGADGAPGRVTLP